VIASLRNALRDPGLTGLYLFAATLHANRSLAILGCLLMLYPMLKPGSPARRVLPRLALYYWLVLLAIYVLLRAVAAIVGEPEAAREHGSDALRFVYFLGVLPVAWHLDGNQQRLLRVLAVALAGFVLARVWHLPDALAVAPEDWLRLRPGLGLEPIGLGYYAGTALIGVLLFLPRVMQQSGGGTATLAIAAVGALLLAFLAQCVIWSQSRGAWLSLLPALVAALAWLLWTGGSARRAQGRGVALLCLVAVGIALLDNRAALSERLLDEQHTLRALARGDIGSIRSADAAGHNFSIGTRINMLRLGLATARTQPLFGAGPAAPRLVLARQDDAALQQWNDFHNAPVDLLVRFGAVGLLLLGGGVATTVVYGLGGDTRRAYASDLRLFLWLALLLLVMSSLSNFRLLNFDWRYCLFLFAGAMASPRLATLRKQAAQAAGHPAPAGQSAPADAG
jgi:hypothetical protein